MVQVFYFQISKTKANKVFKAFFYLRLSFDYFNFFHVKHLRIATVYEMCYINKLALPSLGVTGTQRNVVTGEHSKFPL